MAVAHLSTHIPTTLSATSRDDMADYAAFTQFKIFLGTERQDITDNASRPKVCGGFGITTGRNTRNQSALQEYVKRDAL